MKYHNRISGTKEFVNRTNFPLKIQKKNAIDYEEEGIQGALKPLQKLMTVTYIADIYS